MARSWIFLPIAAVYLGVAALTLPAVAATSDNITYHYYPNGRLQSISYANGTTITYYYDGAGNRTQVVTSCSGSGC